MSGAISKAIKDWQCLVCIQYMQVTPSNSEIFIKCKGDTCSRDRDSCSFLMNSSLEENLKGVLQQYKNRFCSAHIVRAVVSAGQHHVRYTEANRPLNRHHAPFDSYVMGTGARCFYCDYGTLTMLPDGSSGYLHSRRSTS